MARLLPHLDTRYLGRLTLSGGTVEVYEPADRVAMPGGRRVQVVVWPPRKGATDPAVLAGEVDLSWATIVQNIDDIRARSTGVVRKAIDAFWQLPEKPPDAMAFLHACKLDFVGIGCSGSGEKHALMFHDEKNTIGGHDIRIYVNAKMRPTDAEFDG